MFYFITIYLSSYLLLLISGNETKTSDKLIVHIEYKGNDTFILYYNLTTDYSYYLTFRLFEQEQMKFGLFSPTYRYRQNSIKIVNQDNSPKELFYLFIICFHFMRQLNDIDIQCKDMRLLKTDQTQSDRKYLPTYKPLFIPMMYALSILMLVPVIIQHRRYKQEQLIERQKQLRRLSLRISQDDPTILSQIIENGNINLKKLPIEIELPSTKTIFDDDNDNITFTLEKLRPFIEKYDNEESGFTADGCIAHLLDNTPWNSYPTERSPPISLAKRDSNEQYLPMIGTFYNNDDDDQQPIIKSNAYDTVDFFRSNPAFSESDV
jgi:hypothetical protein